MYLAVTTTYRPATDLGFLLYKNPAHVHDLELSFGTGKVFFPEATAERCTAVLMIDVDPIALVRGKTPREYGFTLQEYVNDRPYVASSYLAVALSEAFGTALAGRSKERPLLAQTAIPLEVQIGVLPCRPGENFLRRLFEPLGYNVAVRQLPLDERFPEWGHGPYYRVTLGVMARLCDVLRHLTVLIPASDGAKHYWVGADEVEKLLRRGEGWLAAHPDREVIAHRYLKHRRSLTRLAIERMTAEEMPDPDESEEVHDAEEDQLERPVSLHEQRLGAVVAVLKNASARRIVDLGCGEGKLIERLLKDQEFSELVGFDVSHSALERAEDHLKLEHLPTRLRDRVRFIHGSLTYRDKRLTGYDAATLVEVVEHLDAPRLAALERVVFEAARPKTVIITTPNSEYNVKFDSLPAGSFRHKDHRFEWTRSQFAEWTQRVARQFGYTVRIMPVGPQDAIVGSPTQMGVFSLSA